jgi:acylphosphatase
MKKQAILKIKGDVQGVNYRATARSKARELGVKGYVKNMPDGSVELKAYGEEDDINELIEWCRQGPSAASVNDVQANRKDASAEEFPDTFEIRY